MVRNLLTRERLFFGALALLVCMTAGVSGYITVWYLMSPPAISEAAPEPSRVPRAAQTASASVATPFSTTTPERIIDSLTIADVVPTTGKFITADLQMMVMTLYEDGAVVATYPIIAKGRPGTPEETPSGFYRVLTKEYSHYNGIASVYMPYSMQFYGNYFIHGPPFFTSGALLPGSYSGGCIRLSYANSRAAFEFADRGTGLFVYDPHPATSLQLLTLEAPPAPAIAAHSYLVADADTRDVYLEKNAADQEPSASMTKLMTALVAHETIMLENTISVPRSALADAQAPVSKKYDTFPIGDLLYPLLIASSDGVANHIAQYYGTSNFVSWMNATAHALDMSATHFVDASGASPDNVSSSEDIYRLATYVAHKKSFLLDITRTPKKDLVADSGATYHVSNSNTLYDRTDFIGGMVHEASSTQDTATALFSVTVNGVVRKVAIIVLGSSDYAGDTEKLAAWFTDSAARGAALSQTACAACSTLAHYRKIH